MTNSKMTEADSNLNDLYLRKLDGSFSLKLVKGPHPSSLVNRYAVKVTSTSAENDSMRFFYEDFMDPQNSKVIEGDLNLFDNCDTHCFSNLQNYAKHLKGSKQYELVVDLEILLRGSITSDKAEDYYGLIVDYLRTAKIASKANNDYRLTEHQGVWLDDPCSIKSSGAHVVAVDNKFMKDMFGDSLTEGLSQVKRGLEDLGVLVAYPNDRKDYLCEIKLNTIIKKKCLLFRVDKAQL